MDRFVCANCGYTITERDSRMPFSHCPNCQAMMKFEKSRVNKNVDAQADLPHMGDRLHNEIKRIPVHFTGTANEYFRIWIVNLFLTVITFGIYYAWAKLRSRQYFYRNTVLDDHAFDYTADPVAILKGYLLIGGCIVIYFLLHMINPVYASVAGGGFYLVVPFLICKSLRFFAHNSTYRNIRFRFLGNIRDSYKIYILYPLLVPLTLGLIIPFWEFRKKKYFYDNLSYGTGENVFSGRSWLFYKAYFSAVMMTIGFLLFAGVVVVFFYPEINRALPKEKERMAGYLTLVPFVAYITMLVVATFLQQYLYAWKTNYCLGHSGFSDLRIESTLKGERLFWIRISNIPAIILSLGLLIPWAKVRRMRYILDNLTVITGQDLDHFTSSVEKDESAYGDAAADLFDFDIAL